VHVQWIYAGRRIVLVDTAGINTGRAPDDPVDQMVQEQVERAI
jgi:hypothetical protein